jgi:hypothetical protein
MRRGVPTSAFVASISDIEKDRDARIKKGYEPSLELRYPLDSGFFIARCISYTYGNGSAVGQTAFILDVDRRCPESPVGKCGFEIVADNSFDAEDILVTGERRGVFAR